MEVAIGERRSPILSGWYSTLAADRFFALGFNKSYRFPEESLKNLWDLSSGEP